MLYSSLASTTVLCLCSMMQEVSREVYASQAYDVDLVTTASYDDIGTPLPLSASSVAYIRSMRPKLNILEQAPPDTDLEGGFCAAGDTTDATMWARTSLPAFLELIADVPIDLVVAVRYKYTVNRPSHLVVFGPDNFHLCSCLQLLRRGLPCRHYFAILVNLIGRAYGPTELAFDHTFSGACIHNRWRQADNEQDLPWSVSEVLRSSGHGEGWDGHDEGNDDNYWGPTLDENSDGVHPAEPAVRARKSRNESDQRRVFANMMAKSKENVTDIMRSVSLDQAEAIQKQLGAYVHIILKSSLGGDSEPRNPAPPPQKGRPRKNDSRGKPLQTEGGGKIKDANLQAGNPQGRPDRTRRNKRMRDSTGLGSGRKNKNPKYSGSVD